MKSDVLVIEKVLDILKTRRTVSTDELCHLTAKLTNIIYRLRQEGHKIETQRIGSRGATYQYKGWQRAKKPTR